MSDLILEKVLDPDFPVEGLEWDTLARIILDIVKTREQHQFVLGRLAYSMTKKYGDQAMNKLSKTIEDATGRVVKPNALMGYRWVYDRLRLLDVPEDFPYYTRKILAGLDDPELWLNRVKTEGLSAAQFVREVKLAKGQEVGKKTINCPHCGQPITL